MNIDQPTMENTDEKYCEKCRYFRASVRVPNGVEDKWELSAFCISDGRYGRDLRLKKTIPSYEAYRKEEKKPMPKREYIRIVLSNEDNLFNKVSIPSWCSGYKER